MNIQKLINKNNWPKIYNLIITDKIDPNTKISNGNTITHLAAINNNSKIIKYLLKTHIISLEQSNDEGNSPIFLLAQYSYLDLLKICLTQNPNFLNLTNNNNQSILNILYNNFTFLKYILKLNPQIIIEDNIITKNIDDSKIKNDVNYNIIKLLLNNIKNNYNDSLLSYSISKNKIHISNLLIKNNYDVNQLDLSYQSPLFHAINILNYDLINLLISKNCNINYNGPEGDTNPMIFAIKNNIFKLIDLLLENNFDINSPDRYLNTSTHYALQNNQIKLSTIAKFIYLGDLNKNNINNQTPLHFLIKNYNFEDYNILIKNKKLNIFIKDNSNKRPIDYLLENNIHDFIDIIVDNYSSLINKNLYCKNINNQSCKEEIKKYIFKTKRSIPASDDDIKIKMIITQQNDFGLFNSDSFHNIIYLIILLKKYKNIGIPFQYPINDKIINDQILLNNNLFTSDSELIIFNLVKIYSEYFYDILPYLIIWKSKSQYFIHNNLGFLLKKCLLSNNIRFIIIKLTLITGTNSTHANVILYDKLNNTLERFEPYGTIPYLDFNELNLFIEKFGRENINEDLKFYNPTDILGNIGLQTISNDGEQIVKNLGDPAGFCLAWTLWYLEMRFNNPDVEPKLLIKDVVNNITDNSDINKDKLFIKFIRNYAVELDKEKNKFLKELGVDDNNIYNLVYSEDDLGKILKGVYREFDMIVEERY
jgi:ankyrin repeat protein